MSLKGTARVPAPKITSGPLSPDGAADAAAADCELDFGALDACEDALGGALAGIACPPQLANNNGKVSQKAGRIWINRTPAHSFGQQ